MGMYAFAVTGHRPRVHQFEVACRDSGFRKSSSPGGGGSMLPYRLAFFLEGPGPGWAAGRRTLDGGSRKARRPGCLCVHNVHCSRTRYGLL